jgi:hypothetical protein
MWLRRNCWVNGNLTIDVPKSIPIASLYGPQLEKLINYGKVSPQPQWKRAAQISEDIGVDQQGGGRTKKKDLGLIFFVSQLWLD